MTKQQIEQILENSGFTRYEVTKTSSLYSYGEIEVSIDEHITSIYLGSLELGVCTSLNYRNDELFKIEIGNHHSFDNLKMMIIETKAGESGFYFK